MLNQKWSNKCVLFSCFQEEDRWEDCKVLLCHIQAIIRNAKLHIDCEFILARLSPCPCLFLLEEMDYRIVERKKQKTVSTLIGGRVCTIATR